MHKRLTLVSTLMVLAAAMALPAATTATGGMGYTVVSDACVGTYGWTNYFKVKESASGTTNANRMTIDSWGQTRFGSAGSWHTDQTWPRVSYSYAVDGSGHALTVHRSFAGGNVETLGRIVFHLRIWHNSNLLWGTTIHSRIC